MLSAYQALKPLWVILDLVYPKISPLTHFESICKGVIDVGDLIYYLIFILTFLLLTINFIDKSQYKFAQKKMEGKNNCVTEPGRCPSF